MKVGHHANKMKMGRGRLRGKTGQHNTTAVQEGTTETENGSEGSTTFTPHSLFASSFHNNFNGLHFNGLPKFNVFVTYRSFC